LARIGLWTCAVLFPCALLARGYLFFDNDWSNNLWMVGHFAEHIRQHGSLPAAFNTPALGGVAFPVFYGYLLYPVLGSLAALVGVRNAIRLAVVAVFALQFVCVRRAMRRSGADGALATTTACLVIWAVYPLTNLYSRGALAEFFATGLLTCAVCRWFALLDADSPRARLRAGLEVGLFYALAAGSHPITALYGLAFLLLVSTTAFVRTDRAAVRARLVALVPAAGLTALVLAPWVFAYFSFQGKLTISKPGVFHFTDSIDCWWVRLFPLPLDVRTLRANPDAVPSPHLDAQLNVPLLLLTAVALAGLVRSRLPRRELAWPLLAVIVGGLFLWMSLSPWPFKLLPGVFKFVQFPYRLVTYINLSLLVALLLACRVAAGSPWLVGWGAFSPAFRAGLLSALVTLAGVGVVVKFTHVKERAAVRGLDYAELPGSFYGARDYSMPREFTPLTTEEAASVQPVRMVVEPRAIGRYAPATVELEQPGFVGTQVQAFSWNTFYLDGARVPDAELRIWDGFPPAKDQGWQPGPCTAVRVPAGRPVLAHRFEPDPIWQVLHRLSLISAFGWVLLAIGLRAKRRA
jgi:hypothetical protein